jgi:hypothetical protein
MTSFPPSQRQTVTSCTPRSRASAAWSGRKRQRPSSAAARLAGLDHAACSARCAVPTRCAALRGREPAWARTAPPSLVDAPRPPVVPPLDNTPQPVLPFTGHGSPGADLAKSPRGALDRGPFCWGSPRDRPSSVVCSKPPGCNPGLLPAGPCWSNCARPRLWRPCHTSAPAGSVLGDP